MYLDNIKHPNWLCRVDYSVYFVVLKFMNVMNQNNTRFYVILAPFCFMYSSFNFLNQSESIIAGQALLQSVYFTSEYICFKPHSLQTMISIITCVFFLHTVSAILVLCKLIFLHLYIYVTSVCIILYFY